MKKLVLAAAMSLPLLLSGCVISVGGDDDYTHKSGWEHKEYMNRKAISQLEANTSISEIRHSLGTPDFSELHNQNGEEIRVLFYRTQRIEGDGITTKDECTPLVFKNGLLVGWGETSYASI